VVSRRERIVLPRWLGKSCCGGGKVDTNVFARPLGRSLLGNQLCIRELVRGAQEIALRQSDLSSDGWSQNWLGAKALRRAITRSRGGVELRLSTVKGYFSSNRLTDDHEPKVPSDATARTLHHIVIVGSPETESCEAVAVLFATSGEGKVSLLPTWIL
jgi:hypothetical protein